MEAFKAYFVKRRIVLCNFDLFPPIASYKMHVTQILDLLPVLSLDYRYTVLIDESNTEDGLESTESMSKINKNVGNFISQLRKRHMDLFYVSQWKKGVYNRVREKTDYEIKCRCFRDPENDDEDTNVIGFYYRKIDTDTDDVISKWWIPNWMAKMYYPMYRTKELFIRKIE